MSRLVLTTELGVRDGHADRIRTMPTTPTLHKGDLMSQLRNDLPSLASHAAVELDDVILGRVKSLAAVEQLASVMSEFLTSADKADQLTASVDPRTMVIVSRAINDSGLAGSSPLTKVKDLQQEADVISKKLRSLTEPDALKKLDHDALEKMRAFCLKLSKFAMVSYRAGEEYRHRHPFRR